ncbi:MAG TPA: T9SS type A sorting domain-containing protein [Candidatus Acidoferrales bacterium]|nr:T9SS type A sorting domain-containing protein [Candidatus Acidoferrales bacterium]
MKKSYVKLMAAAMVILSPGFMSSSANFSYFLKTSGDRPYGIAFDGRGAMYMVTAPESGSGTLSLVTPDGTVSKIATLAGTFIGPGITADDSGNALVTVGDKLLKVSHDGTTQTIADGFTRCFDVKLDKIGNIYVADDIKNVVYKITPDGEKEVFYTSSAAGGFVLTAICIDRRQKNMYIKDGSKLFKVPLDTNAATVKLILENSDMFYMCLDSSDNIYVSTIKNVIRIDSTGAAQNLSNQDLNTSTGLSTGGNGFGQQDLYVAVDDGIVELSTLMGIEAHRSHRPDGYMLRQNYPNPFNPATSIDYRLPSNSFITLKVYDALGREVETLVDEKENAGNYTVRFDGSKLSSGIYFYKLASECYIEMKRMVLLK